MATVKKTWNSNFEIKFILSRRWFSVFLGSPAVRVNQTFISSFTSKRGIVKRFTSKFRVSKKVKKTFTSEFLVANYASNRFTSQFTFSDIGWASQFEVL